VHLGIAYDVVEQSFPFYCTKKLFSIFLGAKNGVFCEATTIFKVSHCYQTILKKY
jgi:hypothetical protein